MKTIASCLVVTLGACSMVPEYHRPTMPLPSVWSGPRSGDVTVDPTWWLTFRSDKLASLMKRSLSGNFDLKAAYARIEEARGKAEVAGAPRYPSLDVAATGSSDTHMSSVFAQASYELDFWGKNRAGAAAARGLADASAFDAQTVTITLEASVADSYFELLAFEARLHLAQQIADAARQVLRLVEAQAASGIASDLEVQQQRNVLATFEAAVPALEEQRERAVHLLAVLLGDTPESFRLAGEDLMKMRIPQAQPGLPAAVLERRPDLRAAEARLVAANFDIGRSRAALLPSLTLTGQAGIASIPWSLVAGLVQPLFAGGALHGQLRYDRAHATELIASYRQTVITALQDVEDALVAVQRLAELDKAETVAVESARRASMLARARFEAGTADFLTVLTTEQTWYQAEDAVLQIRLQRLHAAVGVFRALGGSFGSAS